MKKILTCILLSLTFCVLGAHATSALGLKVAPQLYNESLQVGEKKKAFIDVSNPDDVSREIQVEVSGFKQINNDGDLAFFNNPEYAAGISLDYSSFTLGPREALRLYFVIDSDKLPRGGVYATIFLSSTQNSVNPDRTSLQPAAKVGTLLIIDNSGGGSRQAKISDVSSSFFQFGSKISAVASVENTSPEDGLAFFPTIESSTQPFGLKALRTTSPLIFPGITRQTKLSLGGSHLGPVRIRVATEGSVRYRWAFAITGYWRLVVPVSILLITSYLIGRNHYPHPWFKGKKYFKK